MDLKDLILLGGALLIVAVVAHGVWVAWRARRDPLKLKIDERLIAAVVDREPAQTEFPNGGARVVRAGQAMSERREYPLAGNASGASRDESLGVNKAAPIVSPAPPRDEAAPADAAYDELAQEGKAREAMSEPAPRQTEKPEPSLQQPVAPETGARLAADAAPAPRRYSEPVRPATRPATPTRAAVPARGATSGRAATSREPAAEGTPEELFLINVLAPREQPFTGPRVVEALRANGLRFGEMNIFHRVDVATRVFQFSVANVIEPGTFDVAEIDDFRTPGLCFFLRLPGPENPLDAFEDMQRTARDVAERLGGELKDERRSVLTAQTLEHYRSRVAEFCRRRMSIRAG